MEKLFDFVFQKECWFCKKVGRAICYACLHLLPTERLGRCLVCQQASVQGMTHEQCLTTKAPLQLCTVFEYSGNIATIIKIAKYNPKLFSVLKDLSYEGAKLASKCGYDFEGFEVCPIPLSANRERDRGFNQAEIIAKDVCREFGLKLSSEFLQRTKSTGKQFGLHKVERGRNLSGAFEASESVKDKTILLVDDIYTTGSTFLEASKALYLKGAKEVRCYALCRTPKHTQTS
jgi:competence protein ComFC